MNKQLTRKELKELDNINYVAKITREDLLKKVIQKQLAKQQQIQDYENNNFMLRNYPGGNKMFFNNGSAKEQAIIINAPNEKLGVDAEYKWWNPFMVSKSRVEVTGTGTYNFWR